MFRFNNPDALLVFLLVCAAWAMGRATQRGSLRWIVLAGGFVGLAFLAKMMQAFLVLPGFVAMYAVAAPIGLRRRLGHLLAAFAAMVVAGGWWVAVVELWPAGSRPYVGGSQTNSIVELILGYNGFGRLTGDEVGSVVPGGGQGVSMWGPTGWGRLFSSSYGGQVAWLLPAALVDDRGAARDLAPGWAHRPDSCGCPRLGRLAGRHCRGHLLQRGDHPRVLHRGTGPGHRRAGGDRLGDALVIPAGPVGQAGGGGTRRGDGVVVDGPARPLRGIRDMAGPRGPRGRGGRSRRPPGRCTPAAAPHARCGTRWRTGRSGGRAGGPGCLLGADCDEHGVRLAALSWAGRLRGSGRGRSGRPGHGGPGGARAGDACRPRRRCAARCGAGPGTHRASPPSAVCPRPGPPVGLPMVAEPVDCSAAAPPVRR